ncbi:MAG: hypothetical protein R2712_03950 [Vicinamibacterales bacterium]
MPHSWLSFAALLPLTLSLLPALAASQPAPQALNWSADDGARIERLSREGTRLDGAHVVIWFPPSLPRADGDALLARLDPGVEALRAKVGRHEWQSVREPRITYYLSDDQFVSHASGRGAVFVPMARVLDGRAPFLHEATHELLAARTPAGPGAPPPARRPLWLTEGLPDFIAQTVAAESGIREGDVFATGGLAGVDGVCATRAATADGAVMAAAVGTLERPAALFTTDRPRFAPTFYACSFSFVKFLAGRAGLPAVVAAMGVPPSDTVSALERAAGGPIAQLAADWRRAIGLR